jgi:Resolvase, N terminal domain
LHKCIANGFDKVIPFRNAGNPGNADPDFPLHKRSFMQLSFAPRMTTLTKRIRQNSLKMTARVSTDGQSVEAQVRQLTKAGCKKVFREVASGAKTDRAQLRRLLDTLAPGDVVTVTRLDRLARSTRDLHPGHHHRPASRIPFPW